MEKYFIDTAEHGVKTNKNVWNIIKLYLSSKGRLIVSITWYVTVKKL